jgi:hypothetical protein
VRRVIIFGSHERERVKKRCNDEKRAPGMLFDRPIQPV